ncbi:MAG: hypothetical protein H7246_07575 [Phycisphaerae bacterium]|nr:hypothetical protein [Saprospiraceae bacterium]
MKHLLLYLSIAGFFACSESPKNAGGTPKNESYATFEFSREPAVMDMRDPSNWCAANLGEAALINADPKNFYRRLFAFGDVPLRVVIDLGHQSAAFMLYKSGNHVAICTSDNFPTCLSNKANFQISPDGISFRYDNKRDISCDVYLQTLPNGLQIALDLPLNGGHGLAVVRCDACK